MPAVRNMRALIILAVMAATMSNASPVNIGNGVMCTTKDNGNEHYSQCIKVLSPNEAMREIENDAHDEGFFDKFGSFPFFGHKNNMRSLDTRGVEHYGEDERERVRFIEAKKEQDVEADEEIKRKHFAAQKSAEFRKFEKDRRGFDDDDECDDECRRERIRFVEAKKSKDIEADEEIKRKHFAAHKAAEFRKFEKDRRGYDDDDECDDECRRERIRFVEAKKSKDVEADEEIKRKHFAAHKAAEFRKFEKDRRGYDDDEECDDECRRERIRFVEAKKSKDVEADEEIKRKHFAAHKAAEFRKFEKDRRGYDDIECECHDDGDDECWRGYGWYRNGRDCDDECHRERIRFVQAKKVEKVEFDEEARRKHFAAHQDAEFRKFEKDRRGYDDDECDDECHRERIRFAEAKKVKDVEADEETKRKHFAAHKAAEFRKFEKDRRQLGRDSVRIERERERETYNNAATKPVEVVKTRLDREKEQQHEVYAQASSQPAYEPTRHDAFTVEREREREVYNRPRGLYDYGCHDNDDGCWRHHGWYRNGKDCDDECRRERIRFVEAKKVKNVEFDEEIRRKHFAAHQSAEFRKFEKERRGYNDIECECHDDDDDECWRGYGWYRNGRDCDGECRRERIRFVQAKKVEKVEFDEEARRKHFAAHQDAEFRKFEKERRGYDDDDECDDECRRERIRFVEAKKSKDIEADEEIKRKHFAAHKAAEFRKFEKDRRGFDDDDECDDECRRERIRFVEAKKSKDIEADEEIKRKHFAAHKAAEFRKFEKDRRGYDDDDECDDECRRERIRFVEAKKSKDVEADEEIKRKHFAAHKAAEFRKFEKDRRGRDDDDDECDDECRRERIRFVEAKKSKDVEADEEIKRKHFAAHKAAEFRKFEKDRRGYDDIECECHDDGDDECWRGYGWYRNGRDCDGECRRERIRFVRAKKVEKVEFDEEVRRKHFAAHQDAEFRKFEKERRSPGGYGDCDDECRRERLRIKEAKKVKKVEADEEHVHKHFKEHQAEEFRKFEKDRHDHNERIRFEESKKVKDIEADEEIRRKHFQELKKEEVKKVDKERRGLFDLEDCGDACQDRARHSDPANTRGVERIAEPDRQSSDRNPAGYREYERERLQSDYYRHPDSVSSNSANSDRYRPVSQNTEIQQNNVQNAQIISNNDPDTRNSRNPAQSGYSSDQNHVPLAAQNVDGDNKRLSLLEIGL